MSAPDYIELHAASAFSFLEGASQPEALIERAAELGMPAMALLDRNGVYGSARHFSLGAKRGVRSITGAEIAVGGWLPHSAPAAWLPHAVPPEPARVSVLCESRAGYANLSQLITRFKMRETGKAEGAATLDDLREFAPGLLCLTGGDEGPLHAALQGGGEAAGRDAVEELTRIFGSRNVYVELQRHGSREQEWRNQAALRIAESLHLPVVATNGVRHATAEERMVLDVFTTVRHKTDLDHAGRLLQPNGNRFLREPREMGRLFADLPDAIGNTQLIASRIGFQLKDLGYEFPRYPTGPNETMTGVLRQRVEAGIAERYAPANKQKYRDQARKQAEKELGLIAWLGFDGYFLIVWDIVHHCRQNDILIQGRGSAANSVVCYALGITAIDPIEMKLLFERFLSESRGEWPDIDLDLPSGAKREHAIQYVYQRYGELGAAMTANVITYRGRSAAREVGKALGFDEDTIGRLSGLVGHWEWRGPNDTMLHHFQNAGFDLGHPRIRLYLDLVLRLQDLPRHLGQHSGGMVICQGMLNQVVPIERASMAGRTVVQWDKEDCADLGLVKVDLLGLGMMAVMEDCLALVPQHYGVCEDWSNLPQDDPEVFAVLRQADTVGMFQVESRAQMASIPLNAPTRFYDLVVQVAIIRPGPIVGQMMHPYMRRRQGTEKVTYPHPMLKDTLERTLGVPLFQEQLLRMAMVIANFTGAEAEELRRAVGMRRSMQRMKELEVKLRAGMTANKIEDKVQESIVQSVSSFALYGFPESHAASFALIAYASAYFKVKYLPVFTCAMLNNQPMGFYMPAVIVKDAQRHGLRVRPVDVQTSDHLCTVTLEDDRSLSVRLGLNYIKGLRAQVADAIVMQRGGGAFKSTADLFRRVPSLTRAEMAQLARVGALNWVDGVAHRRDALWQVEQVSRPAGPLLDGSDGTPELDADPEHETSETAPRLPVDGDDSMHVEVEGKAEQDNSSPVERQSRRHLQISTVIEPCPTNPLRRMSTEERLVADYGGTGITTGPHPMSYKREELRAAGVKSAAELLRSQDGSYVRSAGCVIARQRPGTAKGFIFLSMEDETGIGNVIVSPQLYEDERATIVTKKFLLVEGRLQNRGGVVHVRADCIRSLAEAALEEMEVGSHDFR